MALKRSLPASGLQRRVKARTTDDWELEEEQDSSSDAPSQEEQGADDASERSDQDEEASSATGSQDSDSEEEQSAKVDLASVSFGALAKAQASLPQAGRKARRAANDAATDRAGAPSADTSATTTPLRRDKGAAKPDRKSLKRSSKHAPQEQTSKKPVSRTREILADPRRKYRDPRFDPLSTGGGGGGRHGPPLDEAKAHSAYAFLDEYRDKEMADMRAQMKKTKDPVAREEMKRTIMSIESRKRARQRKEEEARLLTEHRKKEKELIAQGKRPFYLKKREQQDRLLMDRFKTMSKGQVDKAMERKRKKVAGKEKKEMDFLHRPRNKQ